MNIKLRYEELQAWCLALMVMRFILHLVPFVGYSGLYSVVAQIAVIVSFLFFLIQIKKFKVSNLNLLALFLSLVIGFVFFEKYDFYIMLTSAAYYWPIALMALSGAEVLNIAFKKFVMLYAISLAPSVIMYPFIATGVISPFGIVVPNLEIKDTFGMYYENYLLSFKLVEIGAAGVGLFRLSGLFDEPGVVGTFSAFILITMGYRVREWKGYVILAAGILSFSLAFYLMSLLYLLMRKGVVNRIKVVVFIMLFATMAGSIPFVRERIIDRLEIKDGILAGDNRTTEEVDAAFANFTMSDNVWTGNAGRVDESGVGSASWKAAIMDYGIIGNALIALFFWLLARSKPIRFSRQTVIFSILFVVSVYQRPHIFDPSYILLFIGGLIYISHESGHGLRSIARVAVNKTLPNGSIVSLKSLAAERQARDG